MQMRDQKQQFNHALHVRGHWPQGRLPVFHSNQWHFAAYHSPLSLPHFYSVYSPLAKWRYTSPKENLKKKTLKNIFDNLLASFRQQLMLAWNPFHANLQEEPWNWLLTGLLVRKLNSHIWSFSEWASNKSESTGWETWWGCDKWVYRGENTMTNSQTFSAGC